MILRQSAFRRSPLDALMRSPLEARGRRLVMPTRQLERAAYRLYPWGGRLAIIGTFAERFALYDGTHFRFPLAFEDATYPAYEPGWPYPDEITAETICCQSARNAWDIGAAGDLLVLAGHFTHVNGLYSPAGVIAMQPDGTWSDWSAGLPDLDLDQDRYIHLFSTPGAPMLLQRMIRPAGDPGTYYPTTFYQRWPTAPSWSMLSWSSNVFLEHNEQANWLTGSWAGTGRFPAGSYTWTIGTLEWRSAYNKWVWSIAIYSSSGSGINHFFKLASGYWATVGSVLSRIYHTPTSYVTVNSGYLYRPSNWIGPPNYWISPACVPAQHQGLIVAASYTSDIDRWNPSTEKPTRYALPPEMRSAITATLVSWQGKLYAGGAFAIQHEGDDYVTPLGLIESSSGGESWSAVRAIEDD